MITIKNEYLCASINEKGAELKSLLCDGKQYIWPGDKNIWASSAPHLFPVCGGLKDGEYLFEGEKYEMQKHGYIRFCDFDVEQVSDSDVTFIHKSNEQTKKVFPFDYTLRVGFSIEGKKLTVTYNVESDSDRDMYFSIGPHEGFYCEDGIENYDIILPKTTSLTATVLEGDILGDKKETVLENGNILPLKYDYFPIDALVFKNIDFDSLTLKNRVTGDGLKLEFRAHPYLVLWSKKDAPYICIEPWHGIHDNLQSSKDLKTKEGIIKLDKKERFFISHSIEVL